jgi:hypothetical protein
VVSRLEPAPKLSEDPTNLRRERPENLLRWDLTVGPGQNGEKATAVAYQFKREYARDVVIANLKAKLWNSFPRCDPGWSSVVEDRWRSIRSSRGGEGNEA